MLNRFLKDENGATAIEYGLIAALASLAILGSLGTIASEVQSIFDQSTAQLDP